MKIDELTYKLIDALLQEKLITPDQMDRARGCLRNSIHTEFDCDHKPKEMRNDVEITEE